MTKDYVGNIIDLTGDSYLNPVGAIYGDGSGTHQRLIAKITSIAVHHDAAIREHDYDSVARYHNEAAVHYQRLGPGLQYHYRIDNTGQIFLIRPWTTWLYVVGSSENVSTLAICLDGDFTTQLPTLEQCEALFQLLKNLCEEHPEFPATWPDVRPHADFSPTACCGDHERPYVYAIKDEATALAFPANTGYDWPTEQPGYVATPTAPTPPVDAVSHPAVPPVQVPVPVVPTPPASTVVATPEVPLTVPTPLIPTHLQTPCAITIPAPPAGFWEALVALLKSWFKV